MEAIANLLRQIQAKNQTRETRMSVSYGLLRHQGFVYIGNQMMRHGERNALNGYKWKGQEIQDVVDQARHGEISCWAKQDKIAPAC